MSESSEDEAAEVQGDGDDTNAIQQVQTALGHTLLNVVFTNFIFKIFIIPPFFLENRNTIKFIFYRLKMFLMPKMTKS